VNPLTDAEQQARIDALWEADKHGDQCIDLPGFDGVRLVVWEQTSSVGNQWGWQALLLVGVAPSEAEAKAACIVCALKALDDAARKLRGGVQ
jgi:hypothetical protein